MTKALFLKAVNEQDKLVGVIGGYSENDTMYITLIAVHPDYQNQGIGTKLIEEAEKEFPDRYFRLTVNESHRNISSFLEHCGYEESGRQGNCLRYKKNM
nr:GNAT family N-acetyltransferase [Blautia producta]